MKKQEWLKGWKVIMKDNRMSCTNLHSGCHGVIYKKDTVTGRPKDCGPLAVFRTRKAARRFIMLRVSFSFLPNKKKKVVKCLYKRSKHRRMWNGTRISDALPLGTVLAEKVKCLE